MTDVRAMSTLSAVRKLRPDPIPASVLERVLQAARRAPTGANQQPWRVVVVTDADRKAALPDIYRPAWQRYSKVFIAWMLSLPADELAKSQKVVVTGDQLADQLHEAPAILQCCANPKYMAITDEKLDRVSTVGGRSVYPTMQNAMLACVAERLGCALTTLHCLREDEVQAALDISEPSATVAMMPIGYPRRSRARPDQPATAERTRRPRHVRHRMAMT